MNARFEVRDLRVAQALSSTTQIGIMWNGKNLTAEFRLVIIQEFPQVLGFIAISLRKRDDLIGLVRPISEDDHTMQVG